MASLSCSPFHHRKGSDSIVSLIDCHISYSQTPLSVCAAPYELDIIDCLAHHLLDTSSGLDTEWAEMRYYFSPCLALNLLIASGPILPTLRSMSSFIILSMEGLP